MGINATFRPEDVQKALQKEAEKLHMRIIKAFLYAGERCVAEARTNRTYTDRTGNLTASIGYIVTYNGLVQQMSGFVKDGGSSSGAVGAHEGSELARSIAQNHAQGYCLVVVAGMEYAYAVEARGLNVLTSAERLAEQLVPSLLKQLKLR